MKKILSMITLTVLMVALAGSCTKNFEERLDKAEADLASVRTAIGQYEKLQSDITSVVQSLQNEVGSRPSSEQQTIWACIAALQSQNNTVSAAIDALKALVGEESVSDQIEEALAKLTDSYDLNNLEATLRELKAEVAEKFDVELLESKVDKLSRTVREFDYYLAKLTEIEGMLQSVTIIPQYDDGSVKVKDDTLSIDLVITPKEAVMALETADFTILLNSVMDKADALATVPTASIKAFTKDILNGTVSIKAHIKEILDELGTESLAVTVNVKNGISNYTTEFVKVTVVLPPEGALSRKFSVGTGKMVFFSEGNLKYSKGTDWSDGTWGFFEHQYDYDPGIDNQSSDEYVSLFYWGYTDSSNVKDHVKVVKSCPSDGDNLPYEQDWGSQVLPEKTWRTLTKAEWFYLLDYRKVEARFAKATVNSVCGILIFPDVFEWNTSTMGEEPAYNSHNTGFSPDYTDAQFAFMEEAGVAFLPYAGWREGEKVTIDCGLYWSSTSWGPDGAHALYFDEEYVNTAGDYYRTEGFSVRLVSDCE